MPGGCDRRGPPVGPGPGARVRARLTVRIIVDRSDPARRLTPWRGRNKSIDSDHDLDCAQVAARRTAPIRPAFGLMGDEDWEVT